MAKVIQYRDLQPAARRGSRRDSYVDNNTYHADVAPGESIRIYGRGRQGSKVDGIEIRIPSGTERTAAVMDWLKGILANPVLAAQLEALVRNKEDTVWTNGGYPGMIPLTDWLLEHGAPNVYSARGGRPYLRLWVGDMVVMNRYVPNWVEFDKTFHIGDWAEYDSYNLRYDGPITSIGKKTVILGPLYRVNETHRLDLYKFAWRNWNYDHEEVRRRNDAESMCL